jgi:hypothetical protein
VTEQVPNSLCLLEAHQTHPVHSPRVHGYLEPVVFGTSRFLGFSTEFLCLCLAVPWVSLSWGSVPLDCTIST